MPADFRLVADGFQRALGMLIEAAPVSTERVLKAEAGAILKACAGRTKVAKASAVTTNERLRIIKDLGYNGGNKSADIYINAGIRGAFGKVWRKTRPAPGGGWIFQQTHDANFRVLNRHFGDAVWTDLREAVEDFKYEAAKRIPQARASAGLARQSWIQIADSIGIRLENVPGGNLSASGILKARAAIASNGQAYVNGMSEQEHSQRGFVLRLINRLPFGPKAGLDATLASVLAGRSAYFEQNMARGVFGDMQKLLRAYPGLTVYNN
jgi:hypothetical protein